MGGDGEGYTKDMKGKLTKTVSVAVAGLLAALLITPPASAAKHKRKGRKAAAAKASTQDHYTQMGLENLERGEYPAAIRNFGKASALRGDSASYFLLGWAHYQRGFVKGAPETADAADAQETVTAYNMAIAMDPDLKAVAQPYRLYHSMALSYEALGQYERAVDAYKKAFFAAPNNPMLPLYAARLRWRMNEPQKAQANLKLALAKAKAVGQERQIKDLLNKDPRFQILQGAPPVSPAAQDEVLVAQNEAPIRDAIAEGEDLRDSVRDTTPSERRPKLDERDQAVTDSLAEGNEAFKHRNWRQAIDAYNGALGYNSVSGMLSPAQMGFVHERVGTAYNKLGQSQEAVRALIRSVQAQPFNHNAHYQMALAYGVMGYNQQAVKSLRESLRSAPSPGELRKTMLLAKTDTELDAVRDLPSFSETVGEYAARP